MSAWRLFFLLPPLIAQIASAAKTPAGKRCLLQQNAKAEGESINHNVFSEDSDDTDVEDLLAEAETSRHARHAAPHSAYYSSRHRRGGADREAGLVEYRSKQPGGDSVAYQELGPGECVLQNGQVPDFVVESGKGNECAADCVANMQCQGYSLKGADCKFYTTGPLLAGSVYNEGMSNFDPGATCYGKVLNNPDGSVLPLGVAPTPPPGQFGIGRTSSAHARAPAQYSPPEPPAPAFDPVAQQMSAADKDAQEAEHGVAVLDGAIRKGEQMEEEMNEEVNKLNKDLADANATQTKVVETKRKLQQELLISREAAKSCLDLAEAMRSKLEIIKAAESEVQGKVADTQTQLAQAETDERSLTDKESVLNKQLDEAKSKESEARSQVTKLKGQVTNAEASAAKAARDVETSTRELEAVQTEAKRSEGMWQGKVDANQTLKTDMEKKALAAEEDLASLQDQLEDLKSEVFRKNGELESAQQDARSLGLQSAQLQTEAKEAKERAQRQQAELNAKLAGLRERKEKASARAAVLESKIQVLEEDKTRLTKEKDDLQNHLGRAGEAADMLEPVQ